MNATVHYVNELPKDETIQNCIHCGKIIRDINTTLFLTKKKWAFPKGEVFFIPEGKNVTKITTTPPKNITINKCSK